MNTIEQWVAGDQIQGGRDYQEDSFSIILLADNDAGGDRLLLILADGMGGHAGGAVASDTVVQTFWEGFNKAAAGVADNLRAGIDAANEAIEAKQQSDVALSEMGSTLVAALVLEHHLYWASVGDSILWLFRDGCLHRLNEDHSMRPLLLELVELGRMTEEEALNDPRIHQLRSALVGEDLPLLQIADNGYQLKAGDVVLLASDGLETLSGETLAAEIETHEDDAKEMVRALLDRVSAAAAPNQDNTTALAYRVGHEEHSLHSTLAEMEALTKLPGLKEGGQNIRIQKNVFDRVRKRQKRQGSVFARMVNKIFNSSR